MSALSEAMNEAADARAQWLALDWDAAESLQREAALGMAESIEMMMEAWDK